MGLRTRYSHRDACACRACRMVIALERAEPLTFDDKIRALIVTCAAVALVGLVVLAALASRV